MSTEDERKLFVAGLPESMTEDVLRQLFEAAGSTVVDVSLPRHRDTGKPRGFGFVTLGSAEEASAARSNLDGSMHSGRSISVRPFKAEPPKREGPAAGGGGGGAAAGQDRTLYVGNLPFDATAEEVETLITSTGAGAVIRVHLPTGPDGRARGFGFVTMESNEAANAAIVALRERDLKGRKLMVNIAHPRGERPAGGGDRGGDRPPPRRDEGDRPPPRSFDSLPPASFGEPPPARAEAGRRWADKPDKKKQKKKKGRSERTEAPPKKGRFNPKSWEDWDDD
ncbi:MAG: RNA-binding protein [Polyangiaceae bacterium]